MDENIQEVTVLVAASRESDGKIGTAAAAVEIAWEEQSLEPAPALAAYIESRWGFYLSEAMARGRTLFNGGITCLRKAERRADHTVVLRVYPSDYKTFLVTRLRDRAWFEAHAPEAMASALGNSAFLTRGNEALLGIRSPRVSAYGGRAHLIGGVLDRLGTGDFPATTGGVLQHLFMELKEEAGVDRAECDPGGPRLLEVLRDEVLSQPEAVWLLEMHAPLEEVARRLQEDEHTGHVLLKRGIMDDATWSVMTPVARHAWMTWSA